MKKLFVGFLMLLFNAQIKAATYYQLLDDYILSDTAFFLNAEKDLLELLKEAPLTDKALIHLQLGQIAISRGNENKARVFYYQALAEAGQGNNRQLLFLCYFKLGTFYYLLKAPPGIVVKYLYTAKKLHTAGEYDNAYLRLLRLLGFLELEAMQSFKLAEKTYDELLHLLNNKPESFSYAGVYNNLGILYTEKGQYENAERYLRKSLLLRLKKGDSLQIAQSYENLGTVCREKGELNSALPLYQKALGIQQRKGSVRAAQETIINIGIAYKKKKDYKKALSILEKSFNEARSKKLIEYQLRALAPLAECYAELNQYDKAYNCLNLQNALNKAIKQEAAQDNIIRYNIESSLGKKIFEDSLRYNHHLLKLQFENEKILSLRDERAKRNILSFILIASLIITAALVFYLVNKQKSRMQVKISEIRALQAQMNPHFIFNSLNSVMEYIRQSEKEKALLYLTKFSRLIRLVLEFSSQRTISLEQEIEMLRYYIDLENLRFGNRFSTSLSCADDLDCDSIEIPAMLIQPFVENAILHGLRNQLKLSDEHGEKYEPSLEIKFSLQKDLVRCIVRDNGVGRKKAAEMKQANTFGQKSLGVRITGDRLELIGDKIHKLIYRDLFDDNLKVCGTEVEILIPLEIKY